MKKKKKQGKSIALLMQFSSFTDTEIVHIISIVYTELHMLQVFRVNGEIATFDNQETIVWLTKK